MTSISKLIVGGFKSIRERTEIPIAPLTFLFGPNSAGKSAVLGAAEALRKRISMMFDGAGIESYVSGASDVYGKQVHKRPLTHSTEAADLVSVHLGARLEGFSVVHPSVLFDCSCSAAAKALFGALHGSSVEVEVVEHGRVDLEYSNEPKYDGIESFLRVDGIDLLWFVHQENAGQKGLPQNLYENIFTVDQDSAFAAVVIGKTGVAPNELGSVRINFLHPLWEMTSIASSQDDLANFHHGDALTSDSEREKFANLLFGIKSKISNPEFEFLKQTIAVSGQWLCIGAGVRDFLTSGDWRRALLPPIASSLALQDLEMDQEVLEKFLNLVKSVNVVLTVMNDLCKPILMEVMDELEVVAVDGDRDVLKTVNVTFSFSADEVSDSLCGPFVSSYANWLATRHAGEYILPFRRKSFDVWRAERKGDYKFGVELRKENLIKIRAHDDFVNAALKQNLFGLRRYQVKPAVWRITTTTLLDRDAESDTEFLDEDNMDEVSSFKVQLYLEDQNGRRLDFDEVGSGISYVLPILASLHGAKTSWIAQPELHLHPAAQCEMGDVFLRAFNRGHFSVVETHSEHLLLRVLKRIRQTTRGVQIDDDLKCAPEAVSVLYFDPQEDGSTHIKQMRVSRLGDFKDRWPNGFFEERSRELFDE